MLFLPRVFWGQNWGQNPGRCKPFKTSMCRIHWAVEVRVAVWACSRQRSNPYLPAIPKPKPLKLSEFRGFLLSTGMQGVEEVLKAAGDCSWL